MRDRERRPGRALCTGVASIDRLHGSVTFGAFGSMVAMPFGIYDEPRRGDFELINVVFNECLNVETWPTPAYGS